MNARNRSGWKNSTVNLLDHSLRQSFVLLLARRPDQKQCHLRFPAAPGCCESFEVNQSEMWRLSEEHIREFHWERILTFSHFHLPRIRIMLFILGYINGLPLPSSLSFSFFSTSSKLSFFSFYPQEVGATFVYTCIYIYTTCLTLLYSSIKLKHTTFLHHYIGFSTHCFGAWTKPLIGRYASSPWTNSSWSWTATRSPCLGWKAWATCTANMRILAQPDPSSGSDTLDLSCLSRPAIPSCRRSSLQSKQQSAGSTNSSKRRTADPLKKRLPSHTGAVRQIQHSVNSKNFWIATLHLPRY